MSEFEARDSDECRKWPQCRPSALWLRMSQSHPQQSGTGDKIGAIDADVEKEVSFILEGPEAGKVGSGII
ncbi:hypothetical protein [Sinorhizobium meliloti]|uniref:hypothetical protein n=1 Tax=Rhizobium meliloti TaxID=382 RepID=UPI0013E37687|nr:hypothetical protein [Sinorhizobium meliloti]